MKNRVLDTVAAVVFLVVLITVSCIVGYVETHYTKKATVVEVNETTNEVVVVDTIGHEWAFEGTGYTVGDKVTMTMYTNHTDSIITDDEIVKVK